MSLIEQLGGYEKAKEYLIELQKTPIHEQTEDTVTWLPDMLLEYRRAHNIFEVGDKVVIVGNGTKDLLLEVIEYKYTNNLYRVNVLSTGSCGPIHKDQIRHATDEEIAAGKRLDEK